jgi:hypothetical protein
MKKLVKNGRLENFNQTVPVIGKGGEGTGLPVRFHI